MTTQMATISHADNWVNVMYLRKSMCIIIVHFFTSFPSSQQSRKLKVKLNFCPVPSSLLLHQTFIHSSKPTQKKKKKATSKLLWLSSDSLVKYFQVLWIKDWASRRTTKTEWQIPWQWCKCWFPSLLHILVPNSDTRCPEVVSKCIHNSK